MLKEWNTEFLLTSTEIFNIKLSLFLKERRTGFRFVMFPNLDLLGHIRRKNIFRKDKTYVSSWGSNKRVILAPRRKVGQRIEKRVSKSK